MGGAKLSFSWFEFHEASHVFLGDSIVIGVHGCTMNSHGGELGASVLYNVASVFDRDLARCTARLMWTRRRG